MGWWWSSSPDSSQSQPSSSTTTLPPPIPSHSPSQTQPQPPPSTQPDADADFYAAHPQLSPPPTTASTSTSPSTPPSSSDPDFDPSYPTTMSCRAAFDSAFYCSSLGGHFNDIYRYGQMRACSEQWADWRFCMRIKTRSARDKGLLIQERYKEKEEKVRGSANSEDVWKRLGSEERERALGAFRPGWTPAEGEGL
ncbi:hypothetical protein K491DRAFT_704917 [Lophiostoma macrostomum CBS 122681]|uniref:DUF3128 domain-containing protein n=1 Tax=Lophiostoma macrostomum CBS 122681 TaxID=1314788 RepID=A0A6A6T7T7_9PLEO|nr:hypothetical protein K491DRAFT_704917 [Lophiostoma macrostomum CBS 122681]